MALKFSLNTAQVTGLSQVIIAVPSGKVYDHKARETAGVVTLTTNEENDAQQIRKLEQGGHKVLTEA
jgi:hypothetical protein